MTDEPADKPVRKDERACTTHSVVRFRVTRASPRCPVCRDKAMVHFEVERLPDEHAAIGRAEVPNPPPHPFG